MNVCFQKLLPTSSSNVLIWHARKKRNKKLKRSIRSTWTPPVVKYSSESSRRANLVFFTISTTYNKRTSRMARDRQVRQALCCKASRVAGVTVQVVWGGSGEAAAMYPCAFTHTTANLELLASQATATRATPTSTSSLQQVTWQRSNHEVEFMLSGSIWRLNNISYNFIFFFLCICLSAFSSISSGWYEMHLCYRWSSITSAI